MSKKQATLGSFGYTRTLTTSKGTEFLVHLDKFVKAPDNSNASVGCPHCASNQTFTSRQYLNNHIIYKQPGNNTVKQDDQELRAVIHNEQGNGEKNDQLVDCGLN